MARKAQISKEKRKSITLRHEGQSMQNTSRTFKVSSAVAKSIKRYDELALMRTTTGKEDPEFPLLQGISSAAEFTSPQIAAKINASEFK